VGGSAGEMSALPTMNPPMKRRPRWSLRRGFWLSLGVVAVVVLVFAETSIWVELEMVLGILALLLFLFLFYVLHAGVVFERRETLEISWKGERSGTG
jgi:Ca2+/Na+ antiporter